MYLIKFLIEIKNIIKRRLIKIKKNLSALTKYETNFII